MSEQPEPIKASRAKKKKPARGRPLGSTAWTFPKNTLEDALIIPKAVEQQNAGNPMPADMLVKAVGFKLPNDWRFLDLLRSANQYASSRVPEPPLLFASNKSGRMSSRQAHRTSDKRRC